MNYYDLLKNRSMENPHKLLLRWGDRDYSYFDMLSLVDSLSERAADWAKSCKPILILAKGPVFQIGAFLALEKLGAVPILMHGDRKGETVIDIINHNNLYGIWEVMEEKSLFQPAQGESTERPEDVMGALTSGSTGIPKILYRTYESWGDFFEIQNRTFGVTKTTKIFIHGSLSFTGNLNMLLAVLYAGGSIITCSPIRIGCWNELIKSSEASHIYLVPAKLQLFCREAREPHNTVGHIIAGSQLISSETYESISRSFPQAKVILYYGSGELSYISYKLLGQNDEINNLGRPFEGIQVTSLQGDLYVDTPFHISDIKVPYCCGDTGYVNGQGEIIFTGRRTDWINKGGYKISCLKLEQELEKIVGVQAAAVIPYDDKLRGQEIGAVIVAEGKITAAQIRQSFRQYLDERERPKKIVLTDKLPLNDRGKLDKEVLKVMLCGN